jgi:hypothetical protein
MAAQRRPKGLGAANTDFMTIVVTTTPTYSAGSRRVARAHAAAWSGKKQREERLKVINLFKFIHFLQHNLLKRSFRTRDKAHLQLAASLATKNFMAMPTIRRPPPEVRKRTSLGTHRQDEQDQPREAKNHTWAPLPLPITPRIECMDVENEEELLARDKAKDGVSTHAEMLWKYWKMPFILDQATAKIGTNAYASFYYLYASFRNVCHTN